MNGLAHRIVQIQPRGKIIQLVHQQHQHVLLFALGRTYCGGTHGGLHQQVEAVDVLLIHPIWGNDVVPGHFHNDGDGTALLTHGTANNVGGSVGTVPLELGRYGALLAVTAGQGSKLFCHAAFIRVHEAYQVGVKHHLIIAHIPEEAMEIMGQGGQCILAQRSRHRVPILIQHITLKNQHGL